MIIILILGAIAFVLLTIMTIGLICDRKCIGPDTLKYNGEVWAICTGAPGVVFGLAFLLSGIVSIMTNRSYNCSIVKMKYDQKVLELKSTYNTLTNFDTDTKAVVILEIQSYNTEVRMFKEQTLEAQKQLANPWVNWFTCKEYANFNANEVDYIGI